MTVRSVACAWCGANLQVGAPEIASDAYFVLPRRCRDCAGNNIVELVGAAAIVARVVRKRTRPRAVETARLRFDTRQARRGLTR
jgi:hypothetical protein